MSLKNFTHLPLSKIKLALNPSPTIYSYICSIIESQFNYWLNNGLIFETLTEHSLIPLYNKAKLFILKFKINLIQLSLSYSFYQIEAHPYNILYYLIIIERKTKICFFCLSFFNGFIFKIMIKIDLWIK